VLCGSAESFIPRGEPILNRQFRFRLAPGLFFRYPLRFLRSSAGGFGLRLCCSARGLG
jgi:hypothetical protein